MDKLEEQIQKLEEISKSDNKKVVLYATKLATILKELTKKGISQEDREVLASITDEIIKDYNVKNSGTSLQKGYSRIEKHAQKEFKLFTKGYYTSIYLALGMSMGISLGVAISLAVFDNASYMGIGFAVGIPLGFVIGRKKDKQVEEEGRQLDVK